VTVVVLGMLICLGVAVAVLAAVALPRVRDGERWLTDDGQTAVRDARRRARAMAGEARERAGGVAERASAAARDARQRAEEAVAARRAAPQGDDAAEEPQPTWQPAEGLRPAAAHRDDAPAVDPEPAAEPAAEAAAEPAAPVLAPVPEVVDLRDPEPARGSDGRAGGPVERAIARSLEWGEPEPGPRHRR
jgi:hypothetical protein